MIKRFLSKLFSQRRRNRTRVAVDWMVDLEVPNSDPIHYTGLFALDMSAMGIRLEGGDVQQVRSLLSEGGCVWMKLRLPGMQLPLPRVEAELRWGMGEAPRFRTGWLFTHLDSETQQLLDEYIAAHPEDVITNHS